MTTKNTAANAAKNEVINDDERVSFTVNIQGKDVELTAPASLDDCNFRVAIQMSSGHHHEALATALGERQILKLESLGATVSEFNTIFTALSEAWGLGEG